MSEPEEPGARARPARVVVGVDGSEGSTAALRVAARSAARLHGQLVAVLATGGRAGSDEGRSDRDRMALLRIADLAAATLDAELLAVAVWDDTEVPPTVAAQLGDELMVATKEALDTRIAEAFPDSRPARLRAEIRQGQPAAVLVEESARADLVVVSGSARGGAVSALLGSVCISVAEHAASPVLVVPAVPVEVAGAVAPAGAVAARGT